VSCHVHAYENSYNTVQLHYFRLSELFTHINTRPKTEYFKNFLTDSSNLLVHYNLRNKRQLC